MKEWQQEEHREQKMYAGADGVFYHAEHTLTAITIDDDIMRYAH